jgi:ferrous iron transport protein A
MAQSQPVDAFLSAVASDEVSAERGVLSAAEPSHCVRIVGIVEDADVAAWLRAVGMHEDAVVTVLRRAPFGGPMHLRTSDGGEFAIHKDLARCIQVVRVHRRPPA